MILQHSHRRNISRNHLSLLICVFSLFLSAFSTRAQASLDATDYGAVGDGIKFSVNTESNSTVVTVSGTNTFSSADVGKVIEVFGAGPWVSYSNWGAVVTQQDIVCLITNVSSDGTSLSLSIPCGWTMTAQCIVGNNNAPAFQAAINQATSLVSSGQYTNVTINIPSGTYLAMSSNVLNPNYVMNSISDTHPALTVSSGGITLLGDPSGHTVLMGCGAGMEHLVAPGTPLTWISQGYAPYVPMRDTLVMCQGPVANHQYPLVFQNLTLDGGVQQGQQAYNYWTLIQANGEGWDTTHHAVADYDGLVTYQMNQLKVFTNCVFEHWRGEILICWTGCITNAFNDIANCTFYDGNATADNMYYGQHVHGCTFNSLGKVMEYYQGNATLPMTFENNLITNIAPNNNYALTIVGATTNAVPPPFTIENNLFHDEAGINAMQFSPAANVTVVSNSFIGGPGGVVFTSAGVQPSNGSAIPVMTNFVIACNNFNCANPLSMDGYPVAWVSISNNVGLSVTVAAGFKDHITLANNAGGLLFGGKTASQPGVQSGHYLWDETNNIWSTLNEPQDGGDYAVTNLINYGNGIVHMLRASGSVFYLDDTRPTLIPTNEGPIELQVYAQTWSGANVTNFYMSAASPGVPITITNGAAPMTFYWNTNHWEFNPTLKYTASLTNTSPDVTIDFKSPNSDSDGTAITSWLWSFGDGSTSTNQNPSHTYASLGVFQPTLVVMDKIGLSPTSSGPAINVGNPTLQFTVSHTNGVSRLAVAFKSPGMDSLGTKIKSWLWHFGDGSTSTLQNPSHIYTNAATFHPSLLISNALGLLPVSSGPAAIIVTNPMVKFTASTPNPCPFLTVKFKSPSTDSGKNKITSWSWGFGDDSPVSTEQNPSHVYATLGTFHPTLTVVNQYGVSPTSSGPAINVSNPTVSFTESKSNGVSLFTVAFKAPKADSAGVAIKSWAWNFGDKQVSFLQNPSHTYTNPGTYNPSIIVSNALGLLSSRAGTPILVDFPEAKITVKPTSGSAPLTVEFKSPATDTGGSKILTWLWTFGDGSSSSTNQNPTHIYSNGGTFYPSLRIVNTHYITWSNAVPIIAVSGVGSSAVRTSELVVVNQPPQLSLIISGASAIVSWSTNSTAYTLQSTTNLAPPQNWTTVTSAPVVISSENVVTNPVSGSQMFFRLTQ